jgi:hypothetical protein
MNRKRMKNKSSCSCCLVIPCRMKYVVEDWFSSLMASAKKGEEYRIISTAIVYHDLSH